MKTISPIYILILFLLLAACKKKEKENDGPWLIPSDEVRDGGPGKDGIPSIDNPQFSVVNDISFLDDEDLIVGIKVGSEIKAFPHEILDWHEVVNDQMNGSSFALTYCPLTGTAINYNREINGIVTTFGVSGLLYNSNLIPYDRETDSNWSQMLLQCVNGTLSSQQADVLNSIETTWGTWHKMYPSSMILNENTGSNRSYNVYPYGDYKTSDNLLFSVNSENNVIPKKERVFGIVINGQAKAYQFDNFSTGVTSIIIDQFQEKDLLLVGNSENNFITAFYPETDVLYTAINDSLPIVMKDSNGNFWDIFGHAVSGPNTDSRLTQPIGFFGYWFSWPAFYPNVEIY